MIPVKDNPGIKIVPLKKFTIKGASACEIFFDDARVPAANMLGQMNNGWYELSKTLNHERIIVAALTNGIGTAALEDMVEYAKSREAFGRPIGQYQAIQHKIADTAMDLEFARLITYKAATLLENNRPCYIEAAMAKLVRPEMAFKAGTRGLRYPCRLRLHDRVRHAEVLQGLQTVHLLPHFERDGAEHNCGIFRPSEVVLR